MDKEAKQTLVFVAAGTLIGGFLRGVMQSQEKMSVPVIARTALLVLIAAAIGMGVYKKIK